MNILFLGARNRTTLIERFKYCSELIDGDNNFYSCEAKREFNPISHLCEILTGPDFLSEDFVNWLDSAVRKKHIDIVIPNMDTATIGLANYATEFKTCLSVVSPLDTCDTCYNKDRANSLFGSVMTLPPDDTFPKIVRLKRGFGSRSNKILETPREYQLWLNHSHQPDYVVQNLLDGVEFSVDAFFKLDGSFSYYVRVRQEVECGEVTRSISYQLPHDTLSLVEKTLRLVKFYGPINLQFIISGGTPHFIEINPRFGGGSTMAIEAGLDMANYIVKDRIGLHYTLPAPDELASLTMVRSKRDFFKRNNV